jgi:hypothetical protein
MQRIAALGGGFDFASCNELEPKVPASKDIISVVVKISMRNCRDEVDRGHMLGQR